MNIDNIFNAVCACMESVSADAPIESLPLLRQLGMLVEILVQPGLIFSGMTIVTKLCLLIVLAAGAVAVIAAILRRVSGGKPSGLLTAMAWIAVVFGVLGAAYGAFNIHVGIKAVGKANLAVVAPGLVEIIYTLVPALIVWMIAAVGNASAKRS